MSYGGYDTGYSNGCMEYHVPETCEPMNWYCDGWCQEACKDGWSLTWEWDYNTYESSPVCEKCPEGFNYFVWTMDGRICASGEAPHKHENPGALRNDWGYDWCEWPAQQDWENGGCWDYSCSSGHTPQWAQDGRTQDYTQVCLDQEHQDIQCPPGMAEMSIWEEGSEMNQWGYYNWEEVKYCVKTRPMQSLKTPRHDLHKVFHYYDWMISDSGMMDEEEIPAEASTEDFDTTTDEWVEKEEYMHEYEGSQEEYLMPVAGENFDDLNKHDWEDAYDVMAEHKDVDPNLYTDSAMAYDMADGSFDYAGEHVDSGVWDETPMHENHDSGFHYESYENSWDSAEWHDSGMHDSFENSFENEIVCEGYQPHEYCDCHGDCQEYAASWCGCEAAQACCSDYEHVEHNDYHWDSGMDTNDYHWDSGMGSGYDGFDTTTDYYSMNDGAWDSGMGSGYDGFDATTDYYSMNDGAWDSGMDTNDYQGSGYSTTYQPTEYYYDSGFESGSGYDYSMDYSTSTHQPTEYYDSGFDNTDSGAGYDYSMDSGSWDSGFDSGSGYDYSMDSGSWDSGSGYDYSMDSGSWDSGFGSGHTTDYESGSGFATTDYSMESGSGYGSAFHKRHHKRTHKRKHKRHNRHH